MIRWREPTANIIAEIGRPTDHDVGFEFGHLRPEIVEQGPGSWAGAGDGPDFRIPALINGAGEGLSDADHS
jgi:hypothetical protein